MFYTVETDLFGARVLKGLIDGAAVEDQGIPVPTHQGSGNPVIVGSPAVFPCDDNETAKRRRLHSRAGRVWSPSDNASPVRRIGNGRQIAWPVGRHGLCVQDAAFWAVNVGDLDAPTLSVTGDVLSGAATTGIAAVLEVTDTGDFRISNRRLQFVRWDDGGTILDGTLIQLAYVSGTLTCVYANCDITTGLDGLESNPEGSGLPVEDPL